MKFFTLASTALSLSSTALAAIRQVQLYATSDSEEINGSGLYSTHEGAGINYFFLGAAQTLTYNDESRVLYIDLATQPPAQQYLAFEGEFLALTVGQEPLPVDITEEGTITFPGVETLSAAFNVNDPYRYSESVPAVVNSSPEGSTPIGLRAVFVEVPEPEPEAPSEAPVYENTTVVATEDRTVTVFTTYCPEPTTLTLTICEVVCQATETFVSEPGYVTVSNVVIAEVTEAPVAPEPEAEVTQAPEAPAEPEEPAVVESIFEGAASKAGGASLLALALAAIGFAF
ncbi:uncharacterized protein LODBEIA_P50690 [Lodderomyces beijingensis]|uniref:Uncharacterized protein n=1 Tax=Lodderomyces beijingensis TaxID=1775926 RepID=A0ABP0ZW42_9ASCO